MLKYFLKTTFNIHVHKGFHKVTENKKYIYNYFLPNVPFSFFHLCHIVAESLVVVLVVVIDISIV